MNAGYVSIKESVLKTLQENLDEIQARFGIETIGVFGSVSRGEDTEDSDIDIFYTFSPDRTDYDNFFSLHEYLEALFDRQIEMVSEKCMTPQLRRCVEPDMIVVAKPAGASS